MSEMNKSTFVSGAGLLSFSAGWGVSTYFPAASGRYVAYYGTNGRAITNSLYNAIDSTRLTYTPIGYRPTQLMPGSPYYSQYRSQNYGNSATFDAAESVKSQYGIRATNLSPEYNGISGASRNVFTTPSGMKFNPDLVYNTLSLRNGRTIHLDEIKSVSKLSAGKK